MILQDQANKQENRASKARLAGGMKMSELWRALSWQLTVAGGVLPVEAMQR